MNQELITAIVEEVVRQLLQSGSVILPGSQPPPPQQPCQDISSPECKALPLLTDPTDPEALQRMKRSTTARIGVGRSGPRFNTQTLLTLRADHTVWWASSPLTTPSTFCRKKPPRTWS